jgi:hypothetical protein
MESNEPYTRRSVFPPTHPGTGKKGYPEFDYVNVGYLQFMSYRDWRHHRVLKQVALTLGLHYERGDWGEKGVTRVPPREKELEMQAEYIAKHGIAATCPMKVAEGFGPGWGWDIAYGPMSDEPVKKEIIIIASSASQYSLAFTLPKDQLEWLIVNLIDQRAEESRH